MNTKGKIGLLISLLLLIGCGGKDPIELPITPEFSQSHVTLEESKMVEVMILAGTPSYVVISAAPTIATATVSGSKISISGVKAGTTTLTVTGSDQGKANIAVTVTPLPVIDPYESFKADGALRFEMPGIPIIKNVNASHLFYVDRGLLFSSAKSKLGYASRDGTAFAFFEWNGDATIGTKSNPSLRQGTTSVPLKSLEILKVEGKKLWILATTTDEKNCFIVQEW